MAALALKVGTPHQFSAAFSGQDQNGATVNVTPQGPVTWVSSDPSKLSISSTGLGTPLQSNSDGTPAAVSVSATIPASPFNSAFTGSQATAVSPFVITVTGCVIS